MGLHPSLKRGASLSSNRSVLKRTERIKQLQEKGEWEKTGKVTGLAKTKVLKLKAAKKVKEEKAPAAGDTAKKIGVA